MRLMAVKAILMGNFSFKRPTWKKNKTERYKETMWEEFFLSTWENPSSEIHVLICLLTHIIQNFPLFCIIFFLQFGKHYQ